MPQRSFKEKPQERQGRELDLVGLYSSRSCGDRKSSERPSWLPATIVVTRRALVRRPSVALPVLCWTPPVPSTAIRWRLLSGSTGASVDQGERDQGERPSHHSPTASCQLPPQLNSGRPSPQLHTHRRLNVPVFIATEPRPSLPCAGGGGGIPAELSLA